MILGICLLKKAFSDSALWRSVLACVSPWVAKVFRVGDLLFVQHVFLHMKSIAIKRFVNCQPRRVHVHAHLLQYIDYDFLVCELFCGWPFQ